MIKNLNYSMWSKKNIYSGRCSNMKGKFHILCVELSSSTSTTWLNRPFAHILTYAHMYILFLKIDPCFLYHCCRKCPGHLLLFHYTSDNLDICERNLRKSMLEHSVFFFAATEIKVIQCNRRVSIVTGWWKLKNTCNRSHKETPKFWNIDLQSNKTTTWRLYHIFLYI